MLPVHILVSLCCLFYETAMSWLHTLSEIVDDQVESGLRDDIDQRRQHLQRPLPTTKHHLQHMGTDLVSKSSLQVTGTHLYTRS